MRSIRRDVVRRFSVAPMVRSSSVIRADDDTIPSDRVAARAAANSSVRIHPGVGVERTVKNAKTQDLRARSTLPDDNPGRVGTFPAAHAQGYHRHAEEAGGGAGMKRRR